MKTPPQHTTTDTNSDKFETYPSSSSPASGLSQLQKNTTRIMKDSHQWGFNQNELKIKRFKLDEHNWRLTVINAKTRKTILQAEGHGDTVFANEDNLARMATTLMQQGLTVRTEFDDE